MATVYKCIDCRFQGVVADATEKSWTCPECGRTYKMWNPLEGGPMTPHADLVARLEELASKNGCLSAAYENCIEQGASQSDMCLTCAAATAAKALGALPPPADPQMVPAAESWCDVCTGTGKLLTGARCDLCRGTGKSSEALIGLRELLYAAERERDENEGVFKVWRRRYEQAEAALASRPADPPALVALVEKAQASYREWVEFGMEEEGGLYDEMWQDVTALLAHPLPAAPPVTDKE